MNIKHPLDQFFKDKLDKQHHPLDHEDWKGMAAILDGDSKKRRRLPPFLPPTLLFIGLIFIGWVFIQSDNLPSKKSDAKVGISESTDQSERLNSTLLMNINGGVQDAGRLVNSSANLPSENPSILNKEEIDSEISNHKSIQKTENTANKSSINSGQKSKNNSDKIIKEVLSETPDQVSLHSDTDLTTDRMPLSENPISSHPSAAIHPEIPDQSTFQIISVAEILGKSPTLTATTVSPEMTLSYSKGTALDFDDFEPHLSLGLGGLSSFSNTGYSGIQGGLYGDYHVTEKWVAQMGIHVHSQSNLNLYSQLQVHTTYEFGSDYQVFGMNAKQLTSLAIPLTFYYNQGKNQLGLGYEFDFLLGAKGSVEEIELMETMNRSKVMDVVETVSRGWLDLTPFQTSNSRILMSYRRKLNSTLFAQAQLSYQMKHHLFNQPDQLEEQAIPRTFFGVGLQMYMP